jgi:hypothetical protein
MIAKGFIYAYINITGIRIINLKISNPLNYFRSG